MFIYRLRHVCMRKFNVLQRQYPVNFIFLYQLMGHEVIKIQPVQHAFLHFREIQDFDIVCLRKFIDAEHENVFILCIFLKFFIKALKNRRCSAAVCRYIINQRSHRSSPCSWL